MGNVVSSVASRLAKNTPNFVNKGVKTVADGVGKLIPATDEDHKRMLIIAHAEKEIARLVDQLNYKESTDPSAKLSTKNFNKMTAKDVNVAADKVAIIGHMINIQKCLAEYHQKQMQGIAKVTNVGVISSIIEWLSDSFMHHLIHDRLLLIIESKKLQEKINVLIKEVDKATAYDKFGTEQKLERALTDTQEKVDAFYHTKGIYGLFFGEERNAVRNELNNVVEGSRIKPSENKARELDNSAEPASQTQFTIKA